MPSITMEPDGSISIYVYYTDLSTKAINEIDEVLTEMGHGILYDHIVEEFRIGDVTINRP